MSFRLPTDTLSAIAEVWQDQTMYLIGGAALAMHGLTRRDTDDLDLAIPVSVATLKERMQVAGWIPAKNHEQRWSLTRGGSVVDVLPFGEPHRSSGRVEWPESGQVMNVQGYRHLACAPCLDAALPVNVVLAGRAPLMLLKLLAWNDRPHGRPKDPGDIGCLLAKFLEPTDDRRWTGPVQERDLDYDDASALALGVELGGLVSVDEHDQIGAIVGRIRQRERGESWLTSVSRTLPSPMTNDEDAADRLLALFLEGLTAAQP